MSGSSPAEPYVTACARRGLSPLEIVVQQIEASVASGQPLVINVSGNTVPIQEALKKEKKKKLDDLDLEAVLEGATGLSDIPVVGLQASWNVFTDASAATLAAALPGLPSLQHLEIAGNSIGPAGCQILCHALMSSASLQNLILDCNPIDEDGGTAVASLLAVHPSLTQLSLANCDIGMKALINISSALTTCPALTYLDLTNPRLSTRNEEATYHLAKALRVNRTVNTLVLRKWPHFTETSVASLCDYILDNGGVLQSLDLTSNRLAGPSGVTLAKTLEAGAQLRTLKMSHCRIGDEGACELSRVIRGGGCSLREIDLRHNSIGDAGLAALADAMVTRIPTASGADACALDVLLLAGNDIAAGKAGTTAIGRVLLEGATTCVTDLRAYMVDGVVQLAVEN